MQLIEVTTAIQAKQFLKANVIANAGNPNYIRPLDKDVNEVFDKKTNKTFRFGDAKRWLLLNAKGGVIGRIAAFTNKKYKNKGDDLPVGGIGFFDCIDNQEAANLLFDQAKNWLKQQGMESMDGPINFGERDRWWGLLVDGFEPPVYCMNYNPPYYLSLFENYGFRTFYAQICFARKVKGDMQSKFYERHARIAKDPAYSAGYIDKTQLKKYAVDFATVYNKAWSGHGGLKELHPDVVLLMLKKMKPIMDEKVIWFTYHNEEPVALWVNLPDLNQWFKYLDGKFNLLAKLKFLWYKNTRKCTKFCGLVFGIVPDHQGLGVDAFMIVEGAKIIQYKLNYIDFEMQWIGDFNPKMLNIGESLDTYRSRKLLTMRYLFDREREFKRHPILN